MNHADIRKLLTDYLEGELPLDRRASFDAHLDACDPCAGEVEEMMQTIRLLHTLPEPEIPPMIAANVMRRIRSGESELGFFGRIGRALSVILEPGFVLPASAIAAAALVVSVVQGLGVTPIADVARNSHNANTDERVSTGRPGSSVASLTPSITNTRRGGRTRARDISGVPNGVEFAARVERRRAAQAARTSAARRDSLVLSAGAGSGTRIRIEFEGLGLARGVTPSGSPLLRSRVLDGWTPDFSGIMPGYRSGMASPGMLVAAVDGPATNNFEARSGVWSRAVTQGDFLTGAGDLLGSAGKDPRDAWLALGFEDPAEFARYIAGRNLAEQELWVARLSERAGARGLLAEFLQVLRGSGDPTAAWVADDFAAQVENGHREFSEAEGRFDR